MSGAASPVDDLALLVEAAREAGGIARSFWRRQPRVWEKEAGAGPVTEADLAVNDALHARLTAGRPDYGWLSEESPDDSARLTAPRCFILDPIDGTRAFVDGQEGFSHALAVVEAGRVIAGVVYLPVSDRLYAATADGPATLDGRVIGPAAQSGEPGLDGARLDGATVLTARTNLDPVHWRGGQVPALQRVFRPSLAWRLCLVAEGRFDAALSLRPAWEWDIAAGALIAARAGCAVTDQAGRPLAFNRPVPRVPGLLVAPPTLHRAVLARLAPMGEPR